MQDRLGQRQWPCAVYLNPTVHTPASYERYPESDYHVETYECVSLMIPVQDEQRLDIQELEAEDTGAHWQRHTKDNTRS